MDIFFLDKKNFTVCKHSIDLLTEFSSEKRKIEFFLSRFLLNYVAKNIYNISDTETVLINKKPCFSHSDINFSISHSNDVVLIAFDENPIGVDVEIIKNRDCKKLLNHLQVNIENFNQEKFYQYWTLYEARIKLQISPVSCLSFKIKPNYMLSICSNQSFDISKRLNIYELKSPIQSIKPIELISLNPVKDNIKNENTVVIQEINTASFEYLDPLNLNIE